MAHTATTCRIRWICLRDLEAVEAIDSASHSDPWTADQIKAKLREKRTIGVLAEEISTGAILGFAVYRLYETSMRLMRLSVGPAYRRQSVGTQIINRLTEKLDSHHRERIWCIVPDSNLEAHLFLRKMGFLATAMVRNHFGPGEDGYKMVYRRVK